MSPQYFPGFVQLRCVCWNVRVFFCVRCLGGGMFSFVVNEVVLFICCWTVLLICLLLVFVACFGVVVVVVLWINCVFVCC